MTKSFASGPQRFGFAAGAFGGQAAGSGMVAAGGGTGGLSESMLDSLRERIADNIRERVSQDVREQLESVIKDRIESVQRERLGAAVRTALAEQIVLGGAFNTEQIAQTVRDRIGAGSNARLRESASCLNWLSSYGGPPEPA